MRHKVLILFLISLFIMRHKVFKFGGALLNQIDGFMQMRDIIIKEINNQTSLIIVISAFQKTTANLLEAAKNAENNEKEQSKTILNNIIEYHIKLAHSLIRDTNNLKNIDNFLQENYIELKNLLTGVYITKELSPRTQDLILSFGEILASNIVHIFLQENISNNDIILNDIILFNIIDVLRTNNNYGNAKINLSESLKNIKSTLIPKLNTHKIIITQGFIAKNKVNEITTTAYESSNLTATILAITTNADEFVIWTDVEGIYQTDPNMFNNTKHIPYINFEKAILLAKYGFKLLNYDMISMLKKYNKEVIFRSGFVPSGKSTIIGKENTNNSKFMIYDNQNNFNSKNKINNNNNVKDIILIDCPDNTAEDILQYTNNSINK